MEITHLPKVALCPSKSWYLDGYNATIGRCVIWL